MATVPMPTSAALSDGEVVARVRSGEVRCFETLMRRHNQRLFRIVRAVLQNDAEAEDAVQQAYLSAYSHLDQFEGQSTFATWMTRIALNEAFARRRRAARRAEVEMTESNDDERSLHTAARTPEGYASGRELARLIEAAVDSLPESYRVVFVMRAVEELSTAETAACLDASEETIKVRLHRARRRLQQLLLANVDAGAKEAFAFMGERCDRIVAAVMARLPEV